MSDEHFLSEKRRCRAVISNVCEVCNNGILSQLDTAILDYSPLLLVNSYRDFNSEPPFLWGTS